MTARRKLSSLVNGAIGQVEASVVDVETAPVSQAPGLLKADVATVAHHDVIENLDAEQDTGSRQTRCEFEVLARRCGIAARM